jgi:hypothetical protein
MNREEFDRISSMVDQGMFEEAIKAFVRGKKLEAMEEEDLSPGMRLEKIEKSIAKLEKDLQWRIQDEGLELIYKRKEKQLEALYRLRKLIK